MTMGFVNINDQVESASILPTKPALLSGYTIRRAANMGRSLSGTPDKVWHFRSRSKSLGSGQGQKKEPGQGGPGSLSFTCSTDAGLLVAEPVRELELQRG